MTKAPGHLRPDTRRWYALVAREYALEGHHRKLLTLVCESWDRCQEARERIAEDGAYIADRFGQLKAHPAVAVERDAMISFARLLRELDLDVEPPAEESRPPELRRFKNVS